MRPTHLAASVLVSALVACAHTSGPSPAASASLPPMLIDQRGIVMPLEEAVTKIGFRPYLAPGQILAFAVVPPLGGDDTRENRGLAEEYASGRVAMLLSQWPKQHFRLTFPKHDITMKPCEPVHYKSDGVAWTSRGGLAITLQPDGNVTPSAVDAEAAHLIGAGACK